MSAIDNGLLDIDSLVFSSHKTATQSLVNTLRSQSINARHGHILRHLGLEKGEFSYYIDRFHEKNKKKLTVYTIFREPLARCVSSFFQTYGSDYLDFGHVSKIEETVLYKYGMNALCELFIMEVSEKTLKGYVDSLDILIEELNIDLSRLHFNEKEKIGFYEDDKINIVMLRFDALLEDFRKIMALLLEAEVDLMQVNLSEKKWYHEIYRGFKKNLVLPAEMIDGLYEDKRHLMDIFYPGKFDSMKNSLLDKYAICRR